MALKKVEKFSLYLLLKYKIDSNLKIQKILFFLRVYEKKNKIDNSPIFDYDNENFQAWTYGPVCVDSYNFMCKILDTEEEEIRNDFLIELEKDTKKFDVYDHIVNKLDENEPRHLVSLSHKNLAYINVRKKANIEEWQPCCLPLDETSNDFINFNNANDEINKIFSLE